MTSERIRISLFEQLAASRPVEILPSAEGDRSIQPLHVLREVEDCAISRDARLEIVEHEQAIGSVGKPEQGFEHAGEAEATVDEDEIRDQAEPLQHLPGRRRIAPPPLEPRFGTAGEDGLAPFGRPADIDMDGMEGASLTR